MVDVITIPPNRYANYLNKVYYLKRQGLNKIKSNNAKCAGRGQPIMPYVLYDTNMDSFHPLNVITEEIYD